jgi:predicted tellurium resistance membrane protein TerC
MTPSLVQFMVEGKIFPKSFPQLLIVTRNTHLMSHIKKAKKDRDESTGEREKRQDEKKTAKVFCNFFILITEIIFADHLSLYRF